MAPDSRTARTSGRRTGPSAGVSAHTVERYGVVTPKARSSDHRRQRGVRQCRLSGSMMARRAGLGRRAWAALGSGDAGGTGQPHGGDGRVARATMTAWAAGGYGLVTVLSRPCRGPAQPTLDARWPRRMTAGGRAGSGHRHERRPRLPVLDLECRDQKVPRRFTIDSGQHRISSLVAAGFLNIWQVASPGAPGVPRLVLGLKTCRTGLPAGRTRSGSPAGAIWCAAIRSGGGDPVQDESS